MINIGKIESFMISSFVIRYRGYCCLNNILDSLRRFREIHHIFTTDSRIIQKVTPLLSTAFLKTISKDPNSALK